MTTILFRNSNACAAREPRVRGIKRSAGWKKSRKGQVRRNGKKRELKGVNISVIVDSVDKDAWWMTIDGYLKVQYMRNNQMSERI